MYRTKIEIEVFTDQVITPEEMAQLHLGAPEDWVLGATALSTPRKLSRRETALALLLSDTSIDELFCDSWKYGLQPGDEVTVDSGQPESTGTVIIQTIEYQEHEPWSEEDNLDVVVIVTKEGERIECLIKELS